MVGDGRGYINCITRLQQVLAMLPGAVPAWQVWKNVVALGMDPASSGCVRQTVPRRLGDIFFE